MSPFSSNLANKHVLVTGGSKGIGKSIVELFLTEGANVSFCARSIRGDEFSLFKGAANGARAIGSAVDIGNSDEVKGWVNQAAERFGRIDAVIANDHFFIASPLIGEATPEAWERSFRADIMGLVTLIEASIPYLEERAKASENASIVVISSMAGFEARHRVAGSPYSTFKRAQAVLAKDYARKLGPLGIRINSIAPGSIETPNITLPDGTVQWSQYQIVKRDNYPFYKSLLDAVPLGRTGAPEEVANTVVFLASRLSSYINGTNIIVDGGMSLFF
ncbi:NAD(P)-binding protein [Trichoderma citrinoviride]|uniref:NAD(P)-binding protein n=1 Tax=Trichoderma citrinoviride TaxID=58853 RepID=A0A2T4B027_9HYPO|nr:NAD(P)-binding protein [Trichoderma citrinoviride]PTB62679.1 NAD(P)-binding protein [Trichoderma citrinoviride]